MSVITIQAVKTEHVAKGKTGYEQATVAYISDRGETKEKKVVSFSNPAVFAVVQEAKSGERYEVSYTPGDKYFNWASIKHVEFMSPAAVVNNAGTGVQRSSTYETAEERAKKQVLIVKQSSLNAAIETLRLEGGTAGRDDVKELAQEYVDWVMDTSLGTE